MTWACSWSTIRSSFLAFVSPPLLRFPLPPLPPWKQVCGVAGQSRTRRMSSGGDGTLSESPKINTHVSQIQGMLNSSPGKNNHTAAWFVIIISWCVLYRFMLSMLDCWLSSWAVVVWSRFLFWVDFSVLFWWIEWCCCRVWYWVQWLVWLNGVKDNFFFFFWRDFQEW